MGAASDLRSASTAGWLKSLNSRVLTVLTSGPAHQSFLGNPLLPFLLNAVPLAARRAFALKLLGISPHYFTERNSGRYASMPTFEVLERELERNVVSRRRLYEDVIAPYLKPDMTALDFGCGAGILASEMARRCRAMIGVDISAGVLACGRVLFPAPNLRFAVIDRERIRGIEDASVDLVTAIAVIQHMDDPTFERTMEEFRRILKPNGLALCHIPLKESAAATPHATLHQERRNIVARRLQRQYGLLMLYRDREAIETTAARHDMATESCTVIGTMSTIEDDIAHQQLFVFRRR